MPKRNSRKEPPPLEAPPNSPLIMEVTLQGDGAVYGLSVDAEVWLEENYPDAPRADFAHIGYRNKKDFERLHGPWWEYVAVMVTGLSRNQLIELGGIRLREPYTEEEWEVTTLPVHAR